MMRSHFEPIRDAAHSAQHGGLAGSHLPLPEARRAVDIQHLATEIDSQVRQVADVVAGLPPKQLLARAYWVAVKATEDVQTDLDIGTEQAAALRLVEYFQSVIASVPPAHDQADSIPEEVWHDLIGLADSLFTNVEAYLRAEDGIRRARSHGRGTDLRSLLSWMWLNSRGRNYMVHFYRYYEDMLLPFSDIFARVYGITSEDIITQLKQIHQAPVDAVTETHELWKRIRPALDDGAVTSPELIATTDTGTGVGSDIGLLIDWIAGSRLFDVSRVAALPASMLDDLSWAPGECPDFYGPGDMTGWPLRAWPTFSRPLVKLEERHYCYNPIMLADRLPHALKRGTLGRRPDLKDEWRATQTKQTEDLAVGYLEKMLPGARVWRRPHWDADGKTWETDALIAYDDHLLVVEAKSGAFSPTSPALDFESHVEAVRALGEEPVRQAMRFRDALNGQGEIKLYDSNARGSRQCLGSIARSDYKGVSLIAVTMSPFTEFASQMLHLHDIGLGEALAPAWVVSVDDLRLCADIFDNPLMFLHYIEKRIAAAPLEKLQVDDELDHLAMYLDHNDYDMYVRELVRDEGADLVIALGSRAVIDAHFMQFLPWDHVDAPLRQPMPTRFSEVLDVLAESNEPGKASVGSYLLDSGGVLRDQLDTQIQAELTQQKMRHRPCPLSLYGRSREGVTVMCWSPWVGKRIEGMMVHHTEAVVLMNEEPERLHLELVFDGEERLIDVFWEWVELAGISEHRKIELAPAIRSLRQNRVAAAARGKRAQRRIESGSSRPRLGRNEACPCGSGAKYKRCCLPRFGTGVINVDPGATQSVQLAPN